MPDLAALGAGMVVFMIAIVVVIIAANWKIFTKAGQPGWACIVPIYNLFILCKIAGKPGWWLILCILPYIGIVFQIIVLACVAKNFGKGVGFILGLIFLTPIFLLVLGFGGAQYQGVKLGTPPPAPVA